ncbi:50S ribosomal protein L7/L12 [Melia azedarach]|uniref:50S ribosomal protein L7/L12 n=1 Tax=Melia azedarach TaxID=155640 RepID=A0ACC1YLC0_MELAZ|nr:50S ribosomal protein L7/L12 [Melia azedarach]
MDLGTAGGAAAGSAKVEEKKEKTAFDVKLEKFDAATKVKVIKEVRAFTNLGLKEAKELVLKAPAVLKQRINKEKANKIVEKIKATGRDFRYGMKISNSNCTTDCFLCCKRRFR